MRGVVQSTGMKFVLRDFQNSLFCTLSRQSNAPSSGFATFSPRKKARGEKALDWGER
jgi:hypothetical protein